MRALWGLVGLCLALSIRAELIVEAPLALARRCPSALLAPWPLSPFTSATNETLFANAEFQSGFQNSDDRGGAIVLYDNSWLGLYLLELVLRFQRENASAVVISTTYLDPGRAVYLSIEQYRHLPQFKELRIPFVQVTNIDCFDVINALKTNRNSNTTFRGRIIATAFEDNPYIVVRDSAIGPIEQILELGPSAVAIGLAIWRLIPRLRYFKIQFHIPLIILLLEIVSNVLRIAFAIDPHGKRSLYNNFFVLYLYTPHGAVSLSTHVLILFYWNVALGRFGAKSIGYLKKYVITGLVLFVALDCVGSIIRGLELAWVQVLIVIGIIYALAIVAIIVYVSYSTVQLFQYLKSTKATRDQNAVREKELRTERKVIRMTRLLLASAVFLTFVVIGVGLAFLKTFQASKTEWIPWSSQCLFLGAISICEILVLAPVSQHQQDDFATRKPTSTSTASATASSTLGSSTTSRYGMNETKTTSTGGAIYDIKPKRKFGEDSTISSMKTESVTIGPSNAMEEVASSNTEGIRVATVSSKD